MRFLETCLATIAAASLVSAARVELDWVVGYTTANPDGLFERRVIGINGEWPPKQVDATLGDVLVINVHNELDEPTALHSHGMFQNNTNYMDGPSMVTQCPIPAGMNFTYEFPIAQTGTFWMHSHFMGQYADGFRMPLILHNPKEAYAYDEDITLPMADWYHDQSANNLKTFMSENNPTGAEPVPESGLIMDNVNSSLTFVPGKTYRLRLINMSAFSMFYFSIDGHDLDIIETDGIDTQRTTVKSVYLTAAQRISVLVTAKNSTNLNYYMHADMNTDMFDTIPENLQSNLTAPIYYDRSITEFAPSEDVGMGSEFDDIVIPSLEVMTAVSPDQQLNLTFDFQVYTDGINRGAFNNVPYISPKVPVLNTLLTMGNLSHEPEVYGRHSVPFVLDHLNMIEVVLNNADAGAHPFHLHGHVFQIVARGPGIYDGTNKDIKWYLDNPNRRDTVLVPAESFTIIRFRADNPGIWIFHCHIEWHLETGLAAIFVEAPDIAQQRMTLPQSFNDLCAAGNIPYSGNAAGKQGLDLKGAPSGVDIIFDGFTASGKGAMAGCILSAILGIASIVWFAHSDPEARGREIIAAKMREEQQD
ncbi:Cupredoxin [Phycomyces nitens]|nr:Cupredoxin [Phycomyces nitens]